MASKTFAYRYFVKAPAEAIYTHLMEPSSYVGLSPLVTEVRDVQYGTDGHGLNLVRYLSVEQFHFLGFIHYDNLIRVTTTFTQPGQQMISDVDSPAWVKVRFVFDLQPEGAGTWVSETITARTPPLMLGFVVGEATRVQRAREQILKSRLETPQAPT